MKRFFILLAAMLIGSELCAKVTLPSLLCDNMVLQQQTNANIWGTAKQGAKVTVTTSWNNRSYTAVANSNGEWKTAVATPAAGGPYKVTISDGTPTVLNNVMIGEVWICSGQSNMEMPMAGFPGQPIDNAVQEMISAPQNKNIRYFKVDRKTSSTPLSSCGGTWKLPKESGIAELSATAYFFGKNLSTALDIPIGLIVSSWGGTRIEAWQSAESAQKVNPKVLATDEKQTEPNRTAYLYNGMLLPLTNFTARGFIWYQGESNRSNPQDYAALMQEMVSLWRAKWGDDKMPFYYVQLAQYLYEGVDGITLPLVIEQQTKALDMIPYSGMASTTDVGEINCIHPPQKDVVGQRLALLALDKTYSLKGLDSQCPLFETATYKDGKATVTFKSNSDLSAYHKDVTGFEIAGADKKFYPAKAKIIRNKKQVEVSSPQVADPVAVRYSFRNVINANLCNTSMIPAAPFRTDNWDSK